MAESEPILTWRELVRCGRIKAHSNLLLSGMQNYFGSYRAADFRLVEDRNGEFKLAGGFIPMDIRSELGFRRSIASGYYAGLLDNLLDDESLYKFCKGRCLPAPDYRAYETCQGLGMDFELVAGLAAIGCTHRFAKYGLKFWYSFTSTPNPFVWAENDRNVIRQIVKELRIDPIKFGTGYVHSLMDAQKESEISENSAP